MFYHTAFGLRVASDIPLPELPAAEAGEPDLVFRREPRTGTALEKGWRNGFSPDGSFVVEDAAMAFHMAVRDASAVVYDAAPEQLATGGRTYLLTHGFAAALHFRGILPLHANTLCDAEGRAAIAIAGHKGAGKSSSSLALLQRGWKLVCDDVCAARIDTTPITALPGFPRLKLWPESLTAFGHDPERFDRLWSAWDKRSYPVAASSFHPAPVRLHRIFVLSAASGAADLRTRDLTGVEKVVWLRENLLEAAKQASAADPGVIIHRVAELARRIPMTLIERPAGVDTLTAVVDLISRAPGPSE